MIVIVVIVIVMIVIVVMMIVTMFAIALDLMKMMINKTAMNMLSAIHAQGIVTRMGRDHAGRGPASGLGGEAERPSDEVGCAHMSFTARFHRPAFMADQILKFGEK